MQGPRNVHVCIEVSTALGTDFMPDEDVRTPGPGSQTGAKTESVLARFGMPLL